MENQRDEETYAIIGAAMAVHRELGCGFLEKVYKVALPIEFAQRHIVFRREVDLPIYYQQRQLPVVYTCDFICGTDVLVEVKAIEVLANRDTAQLLNYLKAARIRRGLLLNFGSESLQYKRFVWG